MAVSLPDLELVCLDTEKHDVSAFDCGDPDLNDFLRSDASKYQHDHLSHTRLVFLDGELTGYITLLADSIILETREKKSILDFLRSAHRKLYTFPALKIGRLGISAKYQRAGIGTLLLRYSVGLAARLNTELNIGCRFITVDAYPQSRAWYEQKGFALNKHYEDPGRTHPSMRYDILKGREI